MGMLSQPFIYFNDNVGRVIPNAKMFFYDAGTTTPKNTYTSKSLTNANPWPLVADSAGRFPVAWLENSAYRVIVKDDAGVTIEDRDDINTPEESLNATSAIYFEDETDLALLLAQNGQTVNPSLNDSLVTTGSANPTDGEGSDWVVVAAGTGTPGADFINLANGLQAKRIDPYFRLSNYLQEIEDAGSSAQAEARGNINAQRDLSFSREVWNGSSTSIDLDDMTDGYQGDGLYLVQVAAVYFSIIIIDGNTCAGSSFLPQDGTILVCRTQITGSGYAIRVVSEDFSSGVTTLETILSIRKVGD